MILKIGLPSAMLFYKLVLVFVDSFIGHGLNMLMIALTCQRLQDLTAFIHRFNPSPIYCDNFKFGFINQ